MVKLKMSSLKADANVSKIAFGKMTRAGQPRLQEGEIRAARNCASERRTSRLRWERSCVAATAPTAADVVWFTSSCSLLLSPRWLLVLVSSVLLVVWVIASVYNLRAVVDSPTLVLVSYSIVP